MSDKRATRNRTITLSKEDYKELPRYLSRLEAMANASDLIDTTIHQDLMEVIDYLPQGFADLIVVDPPYNLNKDFNGLKHKATDDDTYVKYVESWLPQVVRCLKPTGTIYICCDWKSSSSIYRVLSGYAHVKNRITWQREKGRGSKTNWKNVLEDIWFATASKNKYYFNVEAVMQKRRVIAPYKVNGKPKGWSETEKGNFRLTHPSNFWDDISIPFWSMPENTNHPTQKPEKLIAKLILASCPEDGVVFDPFLGSGTTSVVAKKLGRHYCGIEINEEYALLAAKRLLIAQESKEIQGYSGGVFWERNTLNEQKQHSAQERKDFISENPSTQSVSTSKLITQLSLNFK